MKHYVKKFIKIFLITLLIAVICFAIAFGGAVLGFWGSMGELEDEVLTMNQNSVIVYTDAEGKEQELYKINSAENREWVDIINIPENLQKAFIAIEDERFMEHSGYDIPRTAKATFTWIIDKITGKSGASLGGSTITQQLIKNLTGEKDQTALRKITEISRAVQLEKKLDKTRILELYLNCIYLSRGCNGVQTASRLYFGKDVKDLDLTECAAIAGITQNPAAYDPIDNPQNNKARRKLVLDKMLELGWITDVEYTEAVNKDITVKKAEESKNKNNGVSSYYVDQVIFDVIRDLKAKGYSEELANRMVYSGGVKIYSAYDPAAQDVVEKYYANASNFGNSGVQSAITVIDTQTGRVAGIAGGVGKKEGTLTLNRASQSPRQPGSTIKPIAAYAPGIELNKITPYSAFEDKEKSYNGWVPKNYDRSYRGTVDVRRALRTSLNTTPVEIVDRIGPQESFNFLRDKFGLTTLVDKRETKDGIVTDIGLSQLGMGGLTDGATTIEMAAAYAAFANGGIYHKPYTYTEVKNQSGEIILSSDREGKKIMDPSTAFIMTELLKEVVSSGTGAGAAISNAGYTAGKTGTTDEDNDRWFIGYTPYYAAAVWYGYDTPKKIYASGNPCIPVFRSIMTSIHQGLKDTSKTNRKPEDVVNISYCLYTGLRAGSGCPATSYYCGTEHIPGYCNGKHSGLSIPSSSDGKEDEEEEEKKTDEKKDDDEKSDSQSGTTANSGGTSNSSTGGSHGTTSGSGTSENSGSGTQSSSKSAELQD